MDQDQKPKVIETFCVQGIEMIPINEYNNLRTDLSIKIQRTVNAAYHALLEISAWMGIPEKKRHKWIEEAMSNVKYCAKHDLRLMDEHNAVTELKIELEKILKERDCFKYDKEQLGIEFVNVCKARDEALAQVKKLMRGEDQK